MKKIFTTACLVLFTTYFPAMAQWSTSPISFPGEERDGAFTFVINGTAYVGGGILLNDMWKFNETTQQFSQLNTVANGFKRAFATSFEHSGFGYVVGGDSAFGYALAEVWKYNPANDTWTRLADFPGGKRVGMATWSNNNRIFVAGGADQFNGTGYGNIYKDCYEYFPATDTWTKLADLPIAVVFPSFFSHGNKIYFVHGSTSNSAYNNDVYEMDIQQQTWGKTVTFPGSARNAGLAFSLGGFVYTGLGQTGFGVSNQDFYLFNPVNGSWIKLGNYPGGECGWSVGFVLNNKAYVGTGLDVETFNFSKSFYTYTGFNTGLGDQQTESLKQEIFPNPAVGTLFANGLKAETFYRILDVFGRTVKEGLTPAYGGIGVNSLTPGTYMFIAEGKATKFVKE